MGKLMCIMYLTLLFEDCGNKMQGYYDTAWHLEDTLEIRNIIY